MHKTSVVRAWNGPWVLVRVGRHRRCRRLLVRLVRLLPISITVGAIGEPPCPVARVLLIAQSFVFCVAAARAQRSRLWPARAAHEGLATHLAHVRCGR